jgi:CubicO group peptidase (beta-lactamase class C family)
VDYQAIQRELAQQLSGGDPELKAVRSVLVNVDGQTVVKYYRDRTPADYAHVWSVTKSVLSILVGIAVDEGRLSVDQTLRELLPRQASVMTEQQASITLRHLLTMTSGLSADDRVMYHPSQDAVREILEYGLSNDPGAVFEYTNGSAHLVAAVLREAIDRSILEYAREKLFDPLKIDTRPAWQGADWDITQTGLTKPGFGWARDGDGIHVGGFGLKLRAPDLLKIGELYSNGGEWDGRQIVSAAWVKESTSPQLTPDQADTLGGQYGYLWLSGEVNGHAFFQASGSYYQRISGIPTRRLVVVVTAAGVEGSPDTLDATLDPILEKVFHPLTQG